MAELATIVRNKLVELVKENKADGRGSRYRGSLSPQQAIGSTVRYAILKAKK